MQFIEDQIIKRTLGAIVGAVPGLGIGIGFLVTAPTWVKHQFGLFVILAFLFGSVIAGAVGSTHQRIVRWLNGAIGGTVGAAVTTFIFVFSWFAFPLSTPIEDSFVAGILLGLIISIPSLIFGGILGLVLGMAGNLIGRKNDFGVLLGAFAASIGAGLAAWFVLGIAVNFNV